MGNYHLYDFQQDVSFARAKVPGYQVSFLIYNDMRDEWSRATKLFPTEAAAIKYARKITGDEGYANISVTEEVV